MEYKGPERRQYLNGYTKETYEKASTDTKLNMLFDYVTAIHGRLSIGCPARLEACDGRFKAIEKRKWVSAGASFSGGVLGGFIAIIAKTVWPFK